MVLAGFPRSYLGYLAPKPIAGNCSCTKAVWLVLEGRLILTACRGRGRHDPRADLGVGNVHNINQVTINKANAKLRPMEIVFIAII